MPQRQRDRLFSDGAGAARLQKPEAARRRMGAGGDSAPTRNPMQCRLPRPGWMVRLAERWPFVPPPPPFNHCCRKLRVGYLLRSGGTWADKLWPPFRQLAGHPKVVGQVCACVRRLACDRHGLPCSCPYNSELTSLRRNVRAQVSAAFFALYLLIAELIILMVLG